MEFKTKTIQFTLTPQYRKYSEKQETNDNGPNLVYLCREKKFQYQNPKHSCGQRQSFLQFAYFKQYMVILFQICSTFKFVSYRAWIGKHFSSNNLLIIIYNFHLSNFFQDIMSSNLCDLWVLIAGTIRAALY